MTDAFAVLGLPRRAALDDETLRCAYAEESRTAHPDHGGSDRAATRVNAAYETLRVPDKRLKHLLELAGPPGAGQWRTVPIDDGLMGLFSRLGAALEASAKFLEKKAGAQSALAKALLASEELGCRETLERIGFDIEGQKADMEHALPALDDKIGRNDSTAWQQLAAMQARFAYLSKWQVQVRERLLQLA